MAKIKLNPFIIEARGSVDGLTLRRMYGRQTLIKKPDMSGVQWSEAQQEHRQRFKQAIAEAQAALADPQVRARYEAAAAKTGKRPFHLAVSDHYHGRGL